MKKICASAAMIALGWSTSVQSAPPPASAFGRTQAILDVEISPNGQRVALMGGASDQRFVSIATLDKPGLPILQLGEVEGVYLQWAGDEFVLVRVAYWEKVGPRNVYRMERTISVTPEATAVAQLFSADPVSSLLTEQNIVGITHAPLRAVALGLIESQGANSNMNTRLQRKGVESPYVMALWSLDPATGRGQLLERGGYDTQGWEIDRDGEVRVRLELDEISHRFAVSGREKGGAGWSRLWEGPDFDSRRSYYGYSAPDEAVYLGLDDKLIAKRLVDGSTSVIAEGFGPVTPRLVWDPYLWTAIGIDAGAEKPAITWLDSEVGATHAALSRAFKDKAVSLWSWSSDRTRFVVRVSAPAAPGAWYLYDKAREELSPLGEEYPELNGAPLGTTRWITYKARDGLEVGAYVTSPPTATSGKAPLIVLPHDGPANRDIYDFDYIAQFLASRGYVVLQPQYRGSAGFGEAFEKAGLGEWGGKMQTDLLDGVAALAASGTIDPRRTCIVGTSFGGYLALAGATLHPEAYRCAVSIGGIADLGLLLQERSRLYGRNSPRLEEQRSLLGGTSAEKLAGSSPARQAAHVTAPILLIHGDKDTLVLPEQSAMMARALKAAGKSYEYLVLKDENSHLSRADTRTQTLEAMGTFLEKHLPIGG